jgi:hypothetical protein
MPDLDGDSPGVGMKWSSTKGWRASEPTWPIAIVVGLLLGCDHSAPFTTAPVTPEGPRSVGAEVQLTFNPDQDYSPNWAPDGSAILYAFVQQGRADHDHCMGMIPAAGGTRIWEVCDDRPAYQDSTEAYPSIALSTTGGLLYFGLIGKVNGYVPEPGGMALWLADFAAPFARRKLVTLPTYVDGIEVDWLSDLVWTNANEFIGLGQTFQLVSHGRCSGCQLLDTVLTGASLIHGTLTPSSVVLHAIPGTDSVNAFSRTPSGTLVVFSVTGHSGVFSVPPTGGSRMLIATFPEAISPFPGDGLPRSLFGLSCRESDCVVSVGTALWRLILATGEKQVLRFPPGDDLYSSPKVRPGGRDVVVQVGGSPGHFGFFNQPGSNLYLYKNLLP